MDPIKLELDSEASSSYLFKSWDAFAPQNLKYATIRFLGLRAFGYNPSDDQLFIVKIDIDGSVFSFATPISQTSSAIYDDGGELKMWQWDIEFSNSPITTQIKRRIQCVITLTPQSEETLWKYRMEWERCEVLVW